MKFKMGDYVKSENRVFRVFSITDKNSHLIPDGWLVDNDGRCVNPKFCESYNGALSVLSANQYTAQLQL